MLQELVNVFIDVEYNCNADNENDGKEIGAEELANDVTIQSGQGRVLCEPFDGQQTANIPRTQRMVQSFPTLFLRVFAMSRTPFLVCE